MNIDEEFERITAESAAALMPYLRRNIENLQRVGMLVGSARDTSAAADILRSAVVFLHASLEDCLRSILSTYLPLAGEAALKNVPLAGTDRRFEKFHLGALWRHRDKDVTDLICDSVAEYAKTLTFNSTSEIVGRLGCLDFVVFPRELFPKVDAMIQRRHRIVHRADRDEAGELCAIDEGLVMDWTETVVKFLAMILANVCNQEAFFRIDQLLVSIARERGIELKPNWPWRPQRQPD